MTTVVEFIKRHSVLTYYTLTFALSWGSVLLIIGGPGRMQATGEEAARLFPAVFLATVAGPGLSGIVMTAIVSGTAGFQDLLSRLRKWRVNPGWYAVAILTTPLSVTASLLTLSLFSPQFRPGFLTTNDATSLAGTLTLPLGVVVGVALVTGFLEELGWTGFAIPRLRLRYGVFATGFLVGLLWGAWHFVSSLLGTAESAGAVPLALYMLALLFTFLPPYRVLMVWVYDRTQSLLVAMLMHASLVTFWLVSTPQGIASAPLAIWYLVWAVVLWVVVGAVWVVKGLELSRHQLRLRPASAWNHGYLWPR